MEIKKNGCIVGNEFNETQQNFTVVGDVVIEDGVASNFNYGSAHNTEIWTSKACYLKYPYINFNVASSWEVIVKFTTANFGTYYTQGIFFSNYNDYYGGIGLNILQQGVLIGYCGSSTSQSSDICRIDIQLSTNTTYMFSFGFTGTEYILKQSSDDGLTWNTVGTVTSSTKVISNHNCNRIGARVPRAEDFMGSIDLKKFAIKVNGKIVFSPALNIGLSDYQIVSEEFYEI